MEVFDPCLKRVRIHVLITVFVRMEGKAQIILIVYSQQIAKIVVYVIQQFVILAQTVMTVVSEMILVIMLMR